MAKSQDMCAYRTKDWPRIMLIHDDSKMLRWTDCVSFLGEVERRSYFVWYCTNYKDLRELMIHVMAQQNSKLVWCTHERKLEWLLKFDECRFANFVSKAWKRKER